MDSFYDFLGKLGYHHPIHPMVIHLPIGLLTGALIFAVVAAVFNREQLRRTARHCIILAFISIFPAIVCGIMDWQHFYDGAWLFPFQVKIVMAPILTCLLFIAILLARRHGATSGRVIVIYFLCFAAIVVEGYFGGEMVFGDSRPTFSSADLKTGEKIYTNDCSSCHPNGGNMLAPSKPVLHSPKLKNLDSFIAVIRHPVAPMPPFPADKISDTEVKALYTYIQHGLQHQME